MLAPEGRPPKNETTPPRRTNCGARSQTLWTPVHSTTASAPRPPVRVRITQTASSSIGTTSNDDRLRTPRAQDQDVQKSEAADTEDRDGHPGVQTEKIDGVHDAGRRFEKCRRFVREPLRLAEGIAGCDVRRQEEILGVSTEDLRLHHAFAQFFLSAATPIARTVGGRMNAHDGVTDGKRG